MELTFRPPYYIFIGLDRHHKITGAEADHVTDAGQGLENVRGQGHETGSGEAGHEKRRAAGHEETDDPDPGIDIDDKIHSFFTAMYIN